MARATYKTGPDRSRRRPDPGFPPPGNPLIMAAQQTIGGSVPDVVWEMNLKLPNNIASIPTGYMKIRQGVPGPVLITPGGAIVQPIAYNINAANELQIEFTGLGSGLHTALLPAFWEGCRGTNGEWIAPAWNQTTIMP